MNLSKYDGTIHPIEWLEKIRAQCKLHMDYKNYTNVESMTLEVAKSLVDSSINVDGIASNAQLLTALKSNILFEIFLASNKQSLHDLSYRFNTCGYDHESTISFLVRFKSLCYNAGITDIYEQKKYLIHSLIIRYQYDFYERIKDINTFDELLKSFQDFIIDQKCHIRNQYIVIIKNVFTGLYLSSTFKFDNPGYVVTLSNNQSDPFCQWQIIDNNLNIDDDIFYGKEILLYNPKTDKYLCSVRDYKSPVSKHQKVFTQHQQSYSPSTWFVQSSNSLNYGEIWKLNDKFSLSHDEDGKNMLLQGHDLHFNIDDKTFQEVVCHNERINRNDEWCIEFLLKKN
ncbi:hypothetical protein C1645_769872 [Glomus cerebriforme]|uniref:MIR domain-containing protein n=1 Tax=Glomus cerebriforme TaxID=658196 RepID=A0A397T5N2_9GLOM|nr:hypothetical protein C1645_769872 [Glomus cerebriforme]